MTPAVAPATLGDDPPSAHAALDAATSDIATSASPPPHRSAIAARAAAGGRTATQSELLGDAAINAANASARHKCGLYALHRALRTVTAPDEPPVPTHLCDRGDGTPQSKEEARAKSAHLNQGHIPDIARFDGVTPTLYEFKCYAFAFLRRALGRGSARGGGAPSTAEGHIVAFGGTEEDLIAKNLGLEQLGTRGEPARDRSTGSGFVAKRDGAYADALTKGSDVHLCVTENSGAINGVLSSILRGLSAAARVPGAVDSTAYGTGRQSTTSHYAHHVAEISTAVQTADAATVLNAASHLAFRLSLGIGG